MPKSVMTKILVLFVVATASSAYAFPIHLTNTRPTPVQTSNQLQADLNSIYGGGVSAVNNQLGLALFQIPTASSVTLTLKFEDTPANLAAANTFGIFGLGSSLDSSTLKTLEVFKGPASPGAKVTLSSVAGGITVGGAGCNNTLENCNGTAPISFSYFGFYLYRPRHSVNFTNDTGTNGFANAGGNAGGNFWTADQLNVATASATKPGAAQSLIFQGSNPNQWTIAFNDVNAVQRDFNDFIVTMDVTHSGSLSAVPEPGAILLFGTAVLGCVTLLRRKAGSAC